MAGLLLVIVSLGVFTAFDVGHALDRRGAPPRPGERPRRSRHLPDALDADLGPLEPEPDADRHAGRQPVHGHARRPSSRPTARAPPRARRVPRRPTTSRSSSTVTWPSIGVPAARDLRDPGRAAERLDLSEQRRPGHRRRGCRERRDPGVGITVSGAGLGRGLDRLDGLRDLRKPPGRELHGHRVGGRVEATSTATATRRTAGPVQTSVVAESTNTLVLQFDDPGSIPTHLRDPAIRSSYPLVPSAADSIVAFNTGLVERAGLRHRRRRQLATLDATGPVPVHLRLRASTRAPARATTRTRPASTRPRHPPRSDPPCPAGRLGAGPIRLPGPAPERVLGRQGRGRPGSRVNGATVKIRDPSAATLPAHPHDQLGRGLACDNPGLPFSHYNVCVRGLVDGSSAPAGPERHQPQRVDRPDPAHRAERLSSTGGGILNAGTTYPDETRLRQSQRRARPLDERDAGRHVHLRDHLHAIMTMVEAAIHNQDRVAKRVVREPERAAGADGDRRHASLGLRGAGHSADPGGQHQQLDHLPRGVRQRGQPDPRQADNLPGRDDDQADPRARAERFAGLLEPSARRARPGPCVAGASQGSIGSPAVALPLFRYYKYVNGEVSTTPLAVAADPPTTRRRRSSSRSPSRSRHGGTPSQRPGEPGHADRLDDPPARAGLRGQRGVEPAMRLIEAIRGRMRRVRQARRAATR